jgi:hypothetical protein
VKVEARSRILRQVSALWAMALVAGFWAGYQGLHFGEGVMGFAVSIEC